MWYVYSQMLEVEVRKLLDVTETIHEEMFQLIERYNLIKLSNRKAIRCLKRVI